MFGHWLAAAMVGSDNSTPHSRLLYDKSPGDNCTWSCWCKVVNKRVQDSHLLGIQPFIDALDVTKNENVCGSKSVKVLSKSDKPFPRSRRQKLAEKKDRKKGNFFVGHTLAYRYSICYRIQSVECLSLSWDWDWVGDYCRSVQDWAGRVCKLISGLTSQSPPVSQGLISGVR